MSLGTTRSKGSVPVTHPSLPLVRERAQESVNILITCFLSRRVTVRDGSVSTCTPVGAVARISGGGGAFGPITGGISQLSLLLSLHLLCRLWSTEKSCSSNPPVASPDAFTSRFWKLWMKICEVSAVRKKGGTGLKIALQRIHSRIRLRRSATGCSLQM